ncbi:MAG TPA: hypothetical protein VHS58_19295 [Acetobacteraceae bacterium]|nr:hypothetical protein [Acetobacteraceae bacterium]
MRDGGSLYDALGPEYTLIRTDPAVPVDALLAGAARRGVPMTLLDIDAAEATTLYPEKLVLSRPDQHVAWRGDALPPAPLALVDRVRGAGPARRTGRRSDQAVLGSTAT